MNDWLFIIKTIKEYNKSAREEVLKYIYEKGKIAKYDTMTATILQDYLRKSLSEEDISEYERVFCRQMDKSKEKIPESIQKLFEGR